MKASRQLCDADATAAFGAALAATLPPRAVLFLHGDLGAGKTSLARGLLRALGVTGTVRSPTYTLVERYDTSAGSVLHLDLYRIADAAELAFLGLDGDTASERLWMIEWPERGAAALPTPDLVVHLAIAGEGREAVLQPRTAVGEGWVAALPDSVGS